MARERKIYTYEEDGYFWITDQYDLNQVRFLTSEERKKWIEGFEPATGKKAIVIEGKPDIVANLVRKGSR